MTEVSVIVAIQYVAGTPKIVTYDPVVMEFHYERNILSRVFDMNSNGKGKMIDIAVAAARSFQDAGVFAVEMFCSGNFEDPTVLVNEIAPRVHNSGHHTIESHDISQFEMLARILLGVPIRKPFQKCSSFEMVNILGTFDGPYNIHVQTGVTPTHVFLHDYGKNESR